MLSGGIILSRWINSYVTHKAGMNQSEKENFQAVSFCHSLGFQQMLVLSSKQDVELIPNDSFSIILPAKNS